MAAQRVALGETVQNRAAEVAAAVVARWAERRSPSDIPYAEAAEVIGRDCRLGTTLIGRYLVNGEGPTPEEKQTLADSGKRAAARQFPWADITKNCLTWRDATLDMVKQEGARLAVDRSVLTEAEAFVQHQGNVGLVRIAKDFDVEQRELTQRLAEERAKLLHLALHDPLTGLPNRSLLMDRLAHAMAQPDRGRPPVTVLFLDLDGFKAVNDHYGHAAGDKVLTSVGECLTSLMRPSDTVARLGGDEYVILCEDLNGGAEALAALIKRLQAGVAACCPLLPDRTMSVSIGAAVAHGYLDPERVLAQADRAMYAVKRVQPVGAR